MPTYDYVAFRSERYAASGTVEADSPEAARDKLIETAHDLAFIDCTGEADDPDHFMIEDDQGGEHHFEDPSTHAPTLAAALKALIACADELIAAIEGVTGQFEDEVSRLCNAATAAETVLAQWGRT